MISLDTSSEVYYGEYEQPQPAPPTESVNIIIDTTYGAVSVPVIDFVVDIYGVK